MQTETYKQHRIDMERHGTGWRAMIWPPGATTPFLGPSDDDPTSYKTVLEKAKRLIDAKAV